MQRGRDQRVAAEAEDDAGRVHRPEPAEARPAGIERQVGIGEKRRHPDADEHREDGPGHGQPDAELDRIVVVLAQPVLGRLRREVVAADEPHHEEACQHHDAAVNAERVVPAGNRHRRADGGHQGEDDDGEAPLEEGEIGHHHSSPPAMGYWHRSGVIEGLLVAFRLLPERRGRRVTRLADGKQLKIIFLMHL